MGGDPLFRLSSLPYELLVLETQPFTMPNHLVQSAHVKEFETEAVQIFNFSLLPTAQQASCVVKTPLPFFTIYSKEFIRGLNTSSKMFSSGACLYIVGYKDLFSYKY